MPRWLLIVVLIFGVAIGVVGWQLVARRDSMPAASPVSETEVVPTQTVLQHMLDSNFEVVRSTAPLPVPVRSWFTVDGRFDLANPGEQINNGQYNEPGRASRRLVFAGIAGDRTFVFFERGGLVNFCELAVFEQGFMSQSYPRMIGSAACSDVPDGGLQQLRTYVANGAFSWRVYKKN